MQKPLIFPFPFAAQRIPLESFSGQNKAFSEVLQHFAHPSMTDSIANIQSRNAHFELWYCRLEGKTSLKKNLTEQMK